jgi:hypothetical protein
VKKVLRGAPLRGGHITDSFEHEARNEIKQRHHTRFIEGILLAMGWPYASKQLPLQRRRRPSHEHALPPDDPPT